ncbi:MULTISPECIES: PadR family transcriptional regulator [unclassified Muribaculum]|uniref:PadR family transcriptional regulator n=1 Tax=Candidatus Merdivivens faecigallinarum TaxID=2840871 RepID=A0A9D9NPU6_9BACT|nr:MULTISPECIES: PadR family transcriptional regulator [unclassified Muribaculum]MBO8481699.1 PadR family transcriptional regulator [Candidatus Merdivivens faecigallinarum]
MNSENTKIQMRRGVLEYCILLILSKGDEYASSIINELRNADMIVVEGTLYPLLIRQKNLGLLSYRWEESPQGPPRKYYSITDKGREYLDELDTAWNGIVASIDSIKRK